MMPLFPSLPHSFFNLSVCSISSFLSNSPFSFLASLINSSSKTPNFFLYTYFSISLQSMPSSSSSINHLSQPWIYERKSRFMKWLSNLFKGGSNKDTTSRPQPQFLGDENMVWRAPARSLDDRPRANKEKDELDHAIALHDGGLNPPPYVPYAPRDLAPQQYYPREHRVCGGCNREIGSGNYFGCMGKYFHPDCFRCQACGYPITEFEFSLSRGNTYHKSCFKETTHPKCVVCHQFMPTNGAGLIEYRCHPFWSQKYCPSHDYDETARCCSCERLESWNVRYVSLGDGRSLCLECMETAIMDTGDCQTLYHSIRDYYEGMNMTIDQQVPVLLVERHVLNEAIEGEKNGFHHMPETRGLCLSEEETITSILKRPRVGGQGLIGMRTQPQKLTRKCKVKAILVLYGLPRLLTGAILAHELMHAWLPLRGYRNLNPEIEEGICQVLAYLWLESEVMPEFKNMPSTSAASSSSWTSSKKGAKSSVENKLGEYFMHKLSHDASQEYGGGFRAANATVKKYGLRRTLDHIRLTGDFPL